MRIQICLAAVMAVSGGAALAQTAGSYTGTSADGQAITLTVATDTNSKLAVAAVSMGISAPCAHGVPTAVVGTGYGTDAVISAKGDFKFKESYVYLYQTFDGAFSGNTITGNVFSVTPSLKDQKLGAPKSAVICTSAKQSYTLTLSNAPMANRLQTIPVYTVHR